MPAVTLGVRLAIGLLAGLMALVWIRQTLALGRGRAMLAALLAAGAAFLSLGGLELLPAAIVRVRIDPVPAGTSIPGTTAVLTGTVSPPDGRVSLWVHPVESNRWWVQPPPRVTTRAAGGARWSGRVYLGDRDRGRGERFEVVAMGSRASLAWDALAGRSYLTGEEVRRLPLLSRSAPVVLRRAP